MIYVITVYFKFICIDLHFNVPIVYMFLFKFKTLNIFAIDIGMHTVYGY